MNAKARLFHEVLEQLKQRPYFKSSDVAPLAGKLGLKISPGTLPVYLSEATASGLIHDAGRGWYSRLSERVPLDAKPVAKLIRAVEKAFPLLEFTIWSTEQIVGYGHHLLGRFTSFVHTERDSMATVGQRLRDEGWDVVVNPRGSIAKNFTTSAAGTVVVRPRTTTQPHDARQVTIEGLLVELFIESRTLNLMDAGEYWRLFENLAGTRRIHMAALLDYARERRPAGLDLAELIKADFLKTPL